MVKDHGELYHFVIASPPDVFDAAVIARTIYGALGAYGWKLYVVGLGSRPRLRFIIDSRLPLAIVKRAVVFGEPELEGFGEALVVDPRGEDIGKVRPGDAAQPVLVVIDYTGAYASRLRGAAKLKRVAALRLNALTYEAVAVVYALSRLREARPTPPPRYQGGLELREAIYVARKLAEALTIVDSYPFVDMNAVAYVLRNIYLRRRRLLDVDGISISYGPAEFRAELEATLYDVRELEPAGKLKVVLEHGKAVITVDGGIVLELLVDFDRRLVCVTRELCFGAEAARRAPEEVLPGGLGIEGGAPAHR